MADTATAMNEKIYFAVIDAQELKQIFNHHI
jgi:hypothetical protein